ncbi:hypothetical protein OE88DRAFT_1807146 [Heliocybe sulcata]|uniref:Uncharacterized protein n=1 Tax=Heliocybe sulcata TaxID=5364 RepID=A0A5C3NF86_9AGAM|nr:hypothetical protein OE88DRAFT_1807146 [Heliocybe sulcata]
MTYYQEAPRVQAVQQSHSAGTTASPKQVLIPRSNRTYLQALQPHVARKEATEIYRRVRILVRGYLDTSRAHNDQQQGKVDEFIARVCEEFPIFHRFEGQWPLQSWLRNRLRLQRARVAKRIGPRPACSSKENQMPLPCGDPDSADKMKCHPRLEQDCSLPPPRTKMGGQGCPQTCASQQGALTLPKQNQVRPSVPYLVEPSRCREALGRASQGPGLVKAKHASEFVEAFLASLELTDLVGVFEELGINTETALRTVARWSREHDDSPLRRLFKDGKINWYEYEALREAFGKGNL